MNGFGTFGNNFGSFGEGEKVVSPTVETPAVDASVTEASATPTPATTGFGAFGGFGGGFGTSSMSADDFFMSPKEAKEKKKAEEKKAAEAKKKEEAAKKKAVSKPQNDVDVSLPVQIKGRNISDTIVGEGVKKLSEIRKELIEKGYKQFFLTQMGLLYHEASATVYVIDSSVTKEYDEEIAIDFGDEGITVCDGMLQAVFTAEDFDKEADEISLKDIIEKWVEINPSYKGCAMAYDADNAVCYPYIKELIEKDYKTKLSGISSYIHASSTYDMEEKEYGEFLKLAEPMLTDFATDKVTACLQYADSGTLFVSYVSNNAYKEGSSVAVKKDKKKVEKKYNLPLTLFVVTWGASYLLTPEMFDGKEKVTADEIKAVMAGKEKMFADNSRKMDTYYDEANNKLSVMFVSGSKGCELIRSAEELERVKQLLYFDGNYCEGTEPFRIRVMPHGYFYTFKKRCQPYRVAFERRAPLIPHAILGAIVDFFRKDLSREACCRIYYNPTTEEFSFQEAKGHYTKAFASYEYEPDIDVLTGRKIHVMDVHSHNTMDAYFSSVDDRDDIYPGVFAVFGKLDEEDPSIKIRVGADGIFQNMEVADFFEMRV